MNRPKPSLAVWIWQTVTEKAYNSINENLHNAYLFVADRSSHHRCSVKTVFLEIGQNSQEDTCASLFFNKKETLAQVFSCEFIEISKNTFFTEHLWATASKFSLILFPFNRIKLMFRFEGDSINSFRENRFKVFQPFTGLGLIYYAHNKFFEFMFTWFFCWFYFVGN